MEKRHARERACALCLRADGLPFVTATHDVNNPASGSPGTVPQFSPVPAEPGRSAHP